MGDFAERRDRYEPANYHIGSDDRLGHGGAKTKFADNIAAIRLYERCGFEKLARLERDTQIGDKYYDTVLMRRFIEKAEATSVAP